MACAVLDCLAGCSRAGAVRAVDRPLASSSSARLEAGAGRREAGCPPARRGCRRSRRVSRLVDHADEDTPRVGVLLDVHACVGTCARGRARRRGSMGRARAGGPTRGSRLDRPRRGPRRCRPYTDTTAFPGSAALLPTVGAALVSPPASVRRQPGWPPGRLLAVAPLRYVGDRSYAFYLWHWPVLVIAAEYEGHALSLTARMVLLAIAFLLAIVSYRCVEDPIRRSRWGGQATALLRPVSVGAVVVVATLAIQASDAESLHLDNAAAAVGASSGQAATPPSGARRTPVVSTPRPRLLTVSTLPTVVAAVGAARRPAPISAALAPFTRPAALRPLRLPARMRCRRRRDFEQDLPTR